jgi:outer membrane protein insertion porin family
LARARETSQTHFDIRQTRLRPTLKAKRRLSLLAHGALPLRLLALATAAIPIAVQAQDIALADRAEFMVSEIRVEGLQRISEGTVFNYLPVNIGDALNVQKVRQSIRALYGTGFFRDVQIRRDGTALIVAVIERPSIERFEITGNKDIKTEDLQKSLRNVGLAAGKTFDRSVLENVQQYLTEQYFSRGKYGVRIQSSVEDLPGNSVSVKVDITEGGRAKIRQINLVGNESFTDKEIQSGFELHTPNWLSWYKQDDRYSREAQQGDLEKLRSFYMDRGYANFRIDSTQVSISPDKNDIFITVNVDEGEVYKIGEIKLSGTFVVPEEELRRYVLTTKGDTFSRKSITATQELIQNRLGADGYAFAKVDPVPVPDEKAHEVALTFFVEPGNRAYVHSISFSGGAHINDEVLRRELRQLEGAWLSNIALERSKQRLQRLPYVKKVEMETTPVAGSADLVDVDFKVEEGPAAQLGGGIGYSETQRVILNGNFVDANFLGSGERIAAEVNAGNLSKVYSFSHSEPYITLDGIGRTLSVSYSDIRRLTASYSDFSTKTYTAGADFNLPVAEMQSVQLGASLQHAEVATSSFSSEQILDWVRENGDSHFRRVGSDYVLSTTAELVELAAGWAFDSRNRTLFPTAGASHRFAVTSTVPGTSIQYATATYQLQQLFSIPAPILKALPFSISTRISYGTAFGGTTSLPPYRHFFVGGPDTVRGFAESSLGPRDSLGNPFGGDASLSGQVESILPLPEKFASTARLSLFFDFGQAFFTGDTKFTDRNGSRVDYGFDLNELRTSAGIGVQWLAPLGLFRFSYAQPLRYRRGTWRTYGDDVERFQFSIGNAF